MHLADEATTLWEKTEEELGEIGLPPPYWAFAWAGGQALARHVIDHPDIVRGRRVLDVAAGSGLVAIAAMLAGARAAEANDIDDFALDAIALNAAANGVSITPRPGDIVGRDEGWDVVLAGDVSYERDMASRMTAWLAALAAQSKEVEVLALLLENAGRVLTREVLIDRVWGLDYVGDTKTLDVHIKRLRGKVETDPANPTRIVTIQIGRAHV